MHWIEEVEKATSFDELVTSRSIVVRNDVHDYDMLHTIVASALKRLLDNHVHFRKRVSVEEQRAQTYDRHLRGRQNADMIFEHFRATGAHEAVQGLSELFSVRLQNDDVQDFERSMGSSSIISKRHAFRCDPGRIVQVKITRRCSASDCLGFVRSRNRSKQWTDKLFTIDDFCKTSYRSDDENSKLQIQSPKRSCGKRSSHQESKCVSARVPWPSAEVRKVFVHNIVEVEDVGQ